MANSSINVDEIRPTTGAAINVADLSALFNNVGTIASQDSSSVSITGGSITGLTTLDVASGATVPTWNQNTTGSAARLTTARTLTVGSTGKSFNGTANVSWSLAEIGAAAASHTHDANEITTGVLAPARLGTGTANTTTYLRGDGTWQVVTSGAIYTQGTGISIEDNQISLATTIGGGPYTFTGNVTAANSVPDLALCTGFISFAGSPATIQSSFGCIVAVTRVSAGVYTLTLSGLSNGNYVVAGWGRATSTNAQFVVVSQNSDSPATSTELRIMTRNNGGTLVDPSKVCVVIFGGK